MQVSFESRFSEGEPLSSEQKNYIGMLRSAFKKNSLEIDTLKLFRYDPKNFQDDYELKNEDKDLSERKKESKLNRLKKKLEFHIKNQVKVVISTNFENIKQVFLTSHVPPTTVELVEDNWTFFFPRPLQSGILWGRYSEKQKHGVGENYFAPLTFNLIEFLKQKGSSVLSEEFLTHLTNLPPNELLSSNKFSICDLITRIRYSNMIRNQFESFRDQAKQSSTGFDLIDDLNENKSLNKVLREDIITLGVKEIVNVASFSSKIDVALLVFNFQTGAIVQLSSFENKLTRSVKVLKELISALNALTSKKF